MHWAFPLAATAGLSNFTTKSIDSWPHVRFTTEASSETWPWRTFESSPHTPPHMKITRLGGGLAAGYIFVSPSNVKESDGTMELSGTGFIMSDDGEMVYAAEERNMGFCTEWTGGMTDFRRQDCNGKPCITYWNGCNTRNSHWGHRWGRVTVIDDEYNNFTINPDLDINTMDPATMGQIDVHEHQMTDRTDRRTMVVTSYNNSKHDLSSVGGPKHGWIADSLFYEIDIDTQEVLFEWHGLDHLSLKLSHFAWHTAGGGTKHTPWDWFHINSVQKVGDNYLVSARHHWTIYLVNGKTGRIIWALDGIQGGSFGSIPSQFRWQHHARAHNITKHGMTVSLFNNHVNGPKTLHTQTQGLAFWLPMPANHRHPPVLTRKLQTSSEPLYSGTQGSYEFDIGNGNGLIGYGAVPIAREYGPKGDLRWQAQFGGLNSVQSYRVFKEKWHGTPKDWNPNVVIEDGRIIPTSEKPNRAYVSWNGATDISDWLVFAGKDADHLESIGVVKKKGFETYFEFDRDISCIGVGAVRHGKVIRSSNIACLSDVAGAPEQVPEAGAEGEVDKTATNEGQADDIPSSADEMEKLKMEKQELEAEKEKLEAEKEELEAGTWVAYRRFGNIAAVVVLVVFGVWAFFFFRDRWRQRGYSNVNDQSPDDAGISLGLDTSGYSWRKRNRANREVKSPSLYESVLGELTEDEVKEKYSDTNRYRSADDAEDEEDEVVSANSRSKGHARHRSGIAIDFADV